MVEWIQIGGVIALFTAEYLENIGVTNYWQITFLILGVIVILMNIGLMFVHEPLSTDRQKKQKETDKLITVSYTHLTLPTILLV